jgi:hypothetical protein
VPELALAGEDPVGRHGLCFTGGHPDSGRRFELVTLPDGGAFDLLGMSAQDGLIWSGGRLEQFAVELDAGLSVDAAEQECHGDHDQPEVFECDDGGADVGERDVAEQG